MSLPTDWNGLVEAGYKFDNESHCRGCGALIEWWVTPTGAKMPMIAKEVGEQEARIGKLKVYERIPHWVDCKNAADFKRKNA